MPRDKRILNPKSIIITGASSGIGEALAKTYAKSDMTLGLIGRNKTRLAAVKKYCEAAGATVLTALIDVRDKEKLQKWIRKFDAEHAVDLLVANAGISGGTGGDGENEEQISHLNSVNIDGVLNTIWALIPMMQKKQSGQIAIMASLAGYRGFPGAPAYCATKAYVKVYGEALRGELCHDNVAVNVICPGYVKSRMTDKNDFFMPFMVSAEKSALVIKKSLQKNRARIAFPWPTVFLAWLFGALPPSFTDILLKRLPKKD